MGAHSATYYDNPAPVRAAATAATTSYFAATDLVSAPASVSALDTALMAAGSSLCWTFC